ncbi:hypothetical protein DY000_02040020 [Brassica cretica]|uniref:F-box domain-containing protein n=1 Tax=Brassica cretica TaxID=69181 RepID=A0ABQ7B741_BRACR|nr:hypothetical protein DY000_02040020 [Brassica cretica]
MANSRFFFLPDELQEKVLQHVAAGSIADLAAVKLTCKQLKEVSERPSVYAAFNLINIHFPLLAQLPATFYVECYRDDNTDAIYLKFMFLAYIIM